MADKVKLTKAQLRELSDMAERDYRSHYDPTYKPIIRLLELGFVESEPSRFGGKTYSITPAGRSALENAQ
jgi:hypothetical protein